MRRLLIPVLILVAAVTTAAAVVPVTDFTAAYNGAGVDVSWTLSDTWHSAGFTIYAGDVRDQPNRLVANVPVGSDPNYHVLDAAGRAGAWYWLHEIDQAGVSTDYGPIQALGPTAVDLVSVDAASRACHVCYCETATKNVYCTLNCTPTAWQKLSCRYRR